MTETIRQAESTAVRTLYVAFELSHATWKLAVTTDRGERARHYTVAAGDVGAALGKLERARAGSGDSPRPPRWRVVTKRGGTASGSIAA
jgi:hypothetical protein